MSHEFAKHDRFEFWRGVKYCGSLSLRFHFDQKLLPSTIFLRRVLLYYTGCSAKTQNHHKKGHKKWAVRANRGLRRALWEAVQRIQ